MYSVTRFSPLINYKQKNLLKDVPKDAVEARCLIAGMPRSPYSTPQHDKAAAPMCIATVCKDVHISSRALMWPV